MNIKKILLILGITFLFSCDREDLYNFMEGHTHPLQPAIKITRSSTSLFNNDSFTVTMRSKTGAVIEYTTDGIDPTPGTGTVYTGAFDVATAGTTQIKAIGHIDIDVSEISSTVISVGDGSGLPYEITTAAQLNNIRAPYLVNTFVQTANIDLSSYSSGEGWLPIGTGGSTFNGSFNGNGFIITGLKINKPTVSGIGLFGEVAGGATLSNIALQGINVTGKVDVGGLAGRADSANISRCSSTGTVYGVDQLTGGLIGNLFNSTINESFSSAVISGGQYTGGLAGFMFDSTINQCYATGDVSATSTGTGGLVGRMEGTGGINGSYSKGKVTGPAPTGGLLGEIGGTSTVNVSVWDKITSNQTDSAGLTPTDGKTTVEMKTESTFSIAPLSWDFTTIWTIQEGVSYPYFQWQGSVNIPY